MGLMTGNGPLGREPAGTFNFEPPAPGRALYLEPTPKRIRVVVGGETIADSRRAMLLHESGHQPIYYFPPEDVRADVLEPSDRHTRCPKKGEASYYTIRAGSGVVEAGAWYYPDPLPEAPPIKDLIAFYFNRMDHWFEEDEEIFVHDAADDLQHDRGDAQPRKEAENEWSQERNGRDNHQVREREVGHRTAPVRVKPAPALVPAARGCRRGAGADGHGHSMPLQGHGRLLLG